MRVFDKAIGPRDPCYTIGALCEVNRIPVLWPGVIAHHEVFHVAVIGGLAAHWVFLYRYAKLLDAPKPD